MGFGPCMARGLLIDTFHHQVARYVPGWNPDEPRCRQENMGMVLTAALPDAQRMFCIRGNARRSRHIGNSPAYDPHPPVPQGKPELPWLQTACPWLGPN